MLAARGARDAADDFLAAVGLIVDCVTVRQLVTRSERQQQGRRYAVAFGGAGTPASLRAKSGGPSGLLLDIRLLFAVASNEIASGPPIWSATILAYEYRLLDAYERELLVFHWQPEGIGRGPTSPHLHVSATISAQMTGGAFQTFPLDRRHIPTGFVSLGEVIGLLVAEFGIVYRHRDWADRLRRAEATFRWGGH